MKIRSRFCPLVVAVLFVSCAARRPLPPRTALDERSVLEGRARAGSASAEALRDLAWLDFLDGNRDAAEAGFARVTALMPADPRALFGQALMADEAGRFSEARELWLRIVEQSAGPASASAPDPWSAPILVAASNMLRLLVGEVAGEARFAERLAAIDLTRLPLDARLRLLGTRATLARNHGDEELGRKLDAEEGCPSEIETSGSYGHLPRLDLLRLAPAALDEAGAPSHPKTGEALTTRVVRARGCSFDLALPRPPGVGRASLWVRAEKSQESALMSIDTDQPWRLFVDGQGAWQSSDRERFAPHLQSIEVPLNAGWHHVALYVAAPGPRTTIGMRIAGEGLHSQAKAPGAGAHPIASAIHAIAHRQPSPPSEAGHGQGSMAARLATLVELLRAYREGDGDAAEELADRLITSSPKFVPGLLLAARGALEDGSRPARFGRDRTRRLFEKALALDEGAVRARYGLAMMDIQDEKPDKALERLEGWHPASPKKTALQEGPKVASRGEGALPAAGLAPGGRTAGDAWRLLMARYEALHARGWLVEAERTLDEAKSSNPEACAPLDADVAVARDQHDLARARRAAAAMVRCAPESDELAQVEREAGDTKAAAAEYRRLLSLDPGREAIRGALAEVLLEAGNAVEAAPLFASLAADHPRLPTYHRLLADALLLTGDKAGAKRALDEGVAEVPESEELARALHALGEPAPIERFRVDGKQVIADFERSGRKYESPAVILLDRTVTRVFATGARLTLTHNIVRVQNKDGIDKWGEVSIPEGADVLVLRTVKADGTTREPEQIAEKKAVSVPDLAPGDYVEFEYLDPAPAPGAFPRGYYAERFFFQSFDAPLDRTEYVLATPEGMPLELDRRGDAPTAVVEHRDGLVIHRFADERKPQLLPEPQPSPFSEYVPSVRAGSGITFAQWADYLEDLQFASLRLNPEVRALAARLKQEAGSARPEALLQTVDAWVRANVRHGGPLDETATSIVARGEGNRVTLERALLAALGVRSELWLARPRSTAALDGALPDLEGYDEPLLAVDIAGADGKATKAIVDPRFHHAPTGFIAPLLRGVPAFAPSDGAGADRGHFQATPGPLVPPADGAAPPAERDLNARANLDARRVHMDVKLDADGGAEVSVTETVTGWPALEWREGLDRIDEDRLRAEFEQRTLGFYFPGASLDDLKLGDRAHDDQPLVVQYRFHAPRFALVEGGRLIVPAPFPALLGKRYVGVGRRATPLELVYTGLQEVDALIHLPPGATAAAEPPAKASAWGNYAQSTTVEDSGHALRLRTRFHLPPERVPPDRYEELVRYAFTVDRAQARAATVVLSRP